VDLGLPPDRVHFFSVPLLARGAVRRVDAVLQFWCLDPESANGDSGTYDSSNPSHRRVVEKVQEWAHELVSKYWGLKENALQALIKAEQARKQASGVGTEPVPKKTEEPSSPSEQQRHQTRGTIAYGATGAHNEDGARAPRTEEESEMMQQKKDGIFFDIFEKLAGMALAKSLTTVKAVETMHEHIRKGRFPASHYVEMWLKRLGGAENPEITRLVAQFEEASSMVTMVFADDEKTAEEEEEVSENDDFAEVVGKTITIRAAGGLKLKVTAEVYDATRLIQGHWRKFWRKKGSALIAKLSSQELRAMIEHLPAVIPVDKVPALDAFTDRGEMGAANRAERGRASLTGNRIAPQRSSTIGGTDSYVNTLGI
jgi:hypothetical protein